MTSVYLFAGPSSYECGIDQSSDDGIDWMPPARRGDIQRLCAEVPTPATIAIADGTFHSYPSVGHEEIRIAIESGWTVYGLCSLGAIRAAEMVHLGMIPYGGVAQKFCSDRDFADDEVCLIHSNEAPFFPMSEPLIHLREFVANLLAQEVLSESQAQSVVQSLKCRWYGERTMQALERELLKSLGHTDLPDIIRRELSDFARYRVKQADLFSFVSTRPWEKIAGMNS